VATTVPLVDRRAATSGPLLITPRRLFDQRLVDAATTAGAQLVTSRVRDVEIQRNGARILTAGREHRAGFLIGADGANSLVRRRLLGAFSRSQLSIATGLFAHGISSSHIIVRFVARPPGYIWSFPRGNHLAIGICAQADESTPAGLRDEIRSWIETAHAPGTAPTHGATCLEPYSWPIPSLSETDLDRFRAGGDRWLLIGDAAGLVDPITREGIYFALRSGAIAAECLGEGNGSARRYTSTIRDEICPELIRAASLKRGFFTTWFTRLTVEALAESQAIRASLVDLAAGRLPYRKLRRRLLRQLEPSAACRLLWREVRVAARRF
jgi:flavin-dependent dehydrogenase